eukprot:TRINITY_DN67018_c0_g1_i1.p1 TRINITY_DN67018_c0_g1~~TRINITY_DN67018_c0_g1_i1.p1  ORF type:complete len:532 (-),score=100.16 TRINITY_DN67018_c0_g1_i1:151-1746(-)
MADAVSAAKPQSAERAVSSESHAKRQRTCPLGSGLKPELVFRELEIDEVQWTNRTDSEKFSAHADSQHNLYVSDTNRIVCFDRNGTYRPVVDGVEAHHIVPNGTADHVVILRKSDKQKLSKVSADGTISTIIETSSALFGPDVCPNGDVVHHPSTSRLERRNPSGELVASIEGSRGKVITFEANSYLTSGQDGHVYFSSKTCVYKWNNQERTVECIAGHPKSPGRRDGFGSDARFTHLKRPVLTRRFAYVRESDNRFCRIDLKTFEVITLQLRGVEIDRIETYGVTPDGLMMFLIFTVPFRVFTAETTDAFESTFFSDMSQVDWTGASGARVNVEFIAGQERRVFRADGRILEARSAYFRSMLPGGMREAKPGTPIELGEDVNGDALQAMLHFLHTDQFQPVTPPSRVLDMDNEDVLKLAKFTMEVHTLADRFLLPRLARLCEVFLSEYTLRISLALPLLANIMSLQRSSLMNLEATCWDFIEDHWKDVVACRETLEELLEQKHPLVIELLQASRGIKRNARRLDDDTPAV